jgi:hypothetical protein
MFNKGFIIELWLLHGGHVHEGQTWFNKDFALQMGCLKAFYNI